LQTWHETFTDQGLTIIGVHYPEFSYERDVDNVRQALADLKIKFPVTIDNDGSTWRAYGQRYWPTMYLIDKAGQIRYLRIGEGGYETTEQWIQYLLAEQL
jgi:alkyl hydroperoxide reductase subunit AhpC